MLNLEILTSLSETATLALAKHRGLLILDWVSSLSEAAALALVRREGNIRLGGVQLISDASAKAMSDRRRLTRDLNGLKTPSLAAATYLAESPSLQLRLDGLTCPIQPRQRSPGIPAVRRSTASTSAGSRISPTVRSRFCASRNRNYFSMASKMFLTPQRRP
jgi:hypothetical protein